MGPVVTIGRRKLFELGGSWGGAAGPELSRIGRTRDAAWLARFTRDPEAVKPGSPMPPYKGLAEAELQAIAAYLASLR